MGTSLLGFALSSLAFALSSVGVFALGAFLARSGAAAEESSTGRILNR